MRELVVCQFFNSKNVSEFGKILGSIFLNVKKDFKVSNNA